MTGTRRDRTLTPGKAPAIPKIKSQGHMRAFTLSTIPASTRGGETVLVLAGPMSTESSKSGFIYV